MFSGDSQLVTEHILAAYDILRAISTPTKFPSATEVAKKLRAFNDLTDEEIAKGHDLVTWMSDMRDILSGETNDADMTIWTESVIERLDFLFIGNIKNTAHIGLSTTNGANDITRYLDNLLLSLRSLTV
jgi:hypothetical protein